MIKIFRHYWIYFAISGALLSIGGFFLVTSGLKLAIDFTGGSLLEVEFAESVPDGVQRISTTIGGVVAVNSVQPIGERGYAIRTREIDNTTKDLISEQLRTSIGDLSEQRFESVGPILGRELLIKTVIAVCGAAVVIMLYVIRQFSELRYGLSAVAAMFHDTLILFGAFALFGKLWNVEVGVLFVTAILTTLSFSIHDTIVVFDRIRELRRKFSKESIHEVADVAVKQTMTRSLNNSLTIIIMLATLTLLGGESIRWFVVALLIGAITGTYSSTFTAVPLLLAWEDIRARRVVGIARKKIKQ